MPYDKRQMERLVDLEFNQLVTTILEVVEFETGGEILSPEGSQMLHETMDATIKNIKEMV